MYNIDKTIKQLNTAMVLLDAFCDGHEFTMHDYKGIAATAPRRIQIRQGATIVQSQEDDGAECQSWSNRAKEN